MIALHWFRERMSAARERLPAPRRLPAFSLLALLSAGVLAIGGALILRGAGQSGSPNPLAGPQLGAGRVAANGLVEGASREIAVFPEVSGTLAVVHVRVNQEVDAGALLFELCNETQKAQVALAEAELASAEAQAQLAKADWSRSRSLLENRAISQEGYDANHYRRVTMEAKVAEAAARLRLARAERAKTQVKAPLPGQVLQVHHEPGVLLGPNKDTDPVLRLANVSRRRVRAWVEELDVARVALGQRALVTADGFPGREFPGKVVEITGRMGQGAPRTNRPREREDAYYREVVIELDAGMELPLNLRVDVFVEAGGVAKEASRPPGT